MDGIGRRRHIGDMSDTKPSEASANAPPDPQTAQDPGRAEAPKTAETAEGRPVPPKQKPGEIGGPKGPEPTRYGDWEVNGRCSDF